MARPQWTGFLFASTLKDEYPNPVPLEWNVYSNHLIIDHKYCYSFCQEAFSYISKPCDSLSFQLLQNIIILAIGLAEINLSRPLHSLYGKHSYLTKL